MVFSAFSVRYIKLIHHSLALGKVYTLEFQNVFLVGISFRSYLRHAEILTACGLCRPK